MQITFFTYNFTGYKSKDYFYIFLLLKEKSSPNEREKRENCLKALCCSCDMCAYTKHNVETFSFRGFLRYARHKGFFLLCCTSSLLRRCNDIQNMLSPSHKKRWNSPSPIMIHSPHHQAHTQPQNNFITFFLRQNTTKKKKPKCPILFFYSANWCLEGAKNTHP